MANIINSISEFLEILEKNSMYIEEFTNITKETKLKCTRTKTSLYVDTIYNKAKADKVLDQNLKKSFVYNLLNGKSNFEDGICLDYSLDMIPLPSQDGLLELAKEETLSFSKQLNPNRVLVLDLTNLLSNLDIKSEYKILCIPKSTLITLNKTAKGMLEREDGYELSSIAYSTITASDTIYKVKQ